MDFEWDETKAQANLKKHGVTFAEAATLFNDPLFVIFYDPEHSQNEQRYIIIGMSTAGRRLMAAYAETETTIRLISSRELTGAERKTYEER